MSEPDQLLYTPQYFADLRDGSQRSAAVVVPIVMKICNPKSVIDLGCGTGEWLYVFRERGIKNFIGIDFKFHSWNAVSPYDFVMADLELPLARGLAGADLVCSLEVAEHLRPSAAELHVAELCRLSPIVLFSAATPGQGGVNHVNEQPHEYWEHLFADHGYVQYDIIRPEIRDDTRVEKWYRDNIFIYRDR